MVILFDVKYSFSYQHEEEKNKEENKITYYEN